jgi:hypothetical protein
MRLKPFKYINGEIYYQCNVCKQWFSKNGFYRKECKDYKEIN